MPRNQFFSKFVSKLDAMDSGSINSYVHLLAREHGFMESVFNAIREGIIIIDDTYHIDVYMVHPRVGLKVPEAQKILHPKLTLISHLHEMHHLYNKWRWPYSVGFEEIDKGKENGFHCAMPMWGEMIRLTADKA